MSQEASQQAANSAEVGQLRAQLSQAEAAAVAAEHQAASAEAQLAEAQQALIDADRRVHKEMASLCHQAYQLRTQPLHAWRAWLPEQVC